MTDSATTVTDAPAEAAADQAPKVTRKRTPKPPTIDQAISLITEALTTPDHPDAAKADALLSGLLDAKAGEAHGDTEHPTVFQAILAVMRDVRAVGKHGRNQDQNYSFRGIDDVMNAVGPAMRRHGLLLFPRLVSTDVEKFERSNSNGRRSYSTSIQAEVEYLFVNAFGGADDSVSVLVPGESIDTSDKATAKAMSVALRTALLQTFALPTYAEDPDLRNPEIETPAPVPAEELRNAAGVAANYPDIAQGFRDLRAHYGDRIGVSVGVTGDGEELPADEYLTRCEQIAVAHRARQQAAAEAAQQDAAAQGPVREVARDDAAQPAGDARAQQPEDARTESDTDRNVRLAGEELAFQSDALGVEYVTYVQPIVNEQGELTAATPGYVTQQRARVIHALHQKGYASVAQAYAAHGQNFPIEVGDLYAALEADHAGSQPREDAHQ